MGEVIIEEKEYEPIEPEIFELSVVDNGQEVIKKYIYDFRLLDIEQTESAIAIGEFRTDQLKLQAGNIQEIFKSQGHRYKSYALSFLLLEIIDDKPVPFDYSKVKHIFNYLSTNKNFTGSIKNLLIRKVGKCFDDFFIAVGMKHLLLGSQEIERKARITNLLLESLVSSQTASITKNLQNKAKESVGLSTKVNSRRGSKKQ